MKTIYWRWKDEKLVIKSYIQKDLSRMLELSGSRWGTHKPLRVLKRDIEVIKVEGK